MLARGTAPGSLRVVCPRTGRTLGTAVRTGATWRTGTVHGSGTAATAWQAVRNVRNS